MKVFVAAAHAFTHACRHGVDVLERRGVLYAEHVGGRVDVDVAAAELLHDGLDQLVVGRGYGDEGEPLAGHLFGMGGSADDGQVVGLDIVVVLQVVGDDHVGGNEVPLPERVGVDLLQGRVKECRGDDQIDGLT